jgi:hypothetical protein
MCRILASVTVILVLLGEGSPPLQAQKGAASPAQGAGGGGGGQQGGATPYFETVMLAHGALNELAMATAQRVCNAVPKTLPYRATVIIYDPQSFQNLGLWQSFATGAEMLADAYRTLPVPTPPGPAPPPQPPPFTALTGATASASFIQGGADLGSLVSAIAASTSNTASTFTIPDSTVAVSLMHQFERINCDAQLVYYPIFGSYTDKESATTNVRNALQNLNEARRTAQDNWKGADATTNGSVYSALTDLNSQYDMLLKDFLTLPGQSGGGGGGQQGANPPGGAQSTGGPTPSATNSSSGAVSLLQGAELEELIEKDDTYILYADVVATGGTQRDIKNVFTLITGDWLSYSGGVVVNIALIKSKETKLEFSDTLRYRTDFHHADLLDVVGFKPFDAPAKSELVEKVNAGSNESTLCNHGRRKGLNPTYPCPADQNKLSTSTPGFLTFARTEITGGTPLQGAITLATPAPDALNVPLFSSDPAIQVASVTIAQRAKAQNFIFQTSPVLGRTPVVVSAKETGITHSQVIYLNADLVSLDAYDLTGGAQMMGYVVLPHSAPKGGTTVNLFSSDPTVTLPAAIVMDEGNYIQVFNVTTSQVATAIRVIISASYDNVVRSVELTVHQ